MFEYTAAGDNGVQRQYEEYHVRIAEKDAFRILAISRDITERKQAEAALQATENNYRSLVESIQDGIFTIDHQGIYRFINSYAAEHLGGQPEAIIGRNMQDFFPEEIGKYQMSLVRQVFATGQPVNVESQSFIMNQPRWYHTILQPVCSDAGAFDTVLCVATDITERKQSEEKIKASLAEKEVLLKEVHHRVKNNLAIVSSLLEMQARRSPDEQVRNEFKVSQQRILAMAQIHEQLYRSQNLAQIDMGSYVVALTNNLHSMDILSDVSMKVDIQDVRLDIDQAVPCGLIINELLTNALKYAFSGSEAGSHPAGGPRKQVQVSMKAENGSYILTVSDNGAGLPDGVDVDSTRTLGLRLVNRLTGQLGGSLRVGSPGDGGTAITISFPAQE